MLGTDVCNALRAAQHDVVATDRDLDITDVKTVADHMASNPTVNWVINCAAYTAVDAAEDNEVEAHRINAIGPGVLTEVCMRSDARLLHISTDYVFDGQSNSPCKPTDSPNPTGAYGRTKLAGERAVGSASDTALILRTAWLYGPAGRNFVSTMIRLMNERSLVTIVNDQHGSPTYTRDLAKTIRKIVETTPEAGGIYHYTGAGETTWYGFACEIYQQARSRGLITSVCDLQPTTTEAYGAKAQRPAYSSLDCTTTESVFGIQLRDWRTALDEYLGGIPT